MAVCLTRYKYGAKRRTELKHTWYRSLYLSFWSDVESGEKMKPGVQSSGRWNILDCPSHQNYLINLTEKTCSVLDLKNSC